MFNFTALTSAAGDPPEVNALQSVSPVQCNDKEALGERTATEMSEPSKKKKYGERRILRRFGWFG